MQKSRSFARLALCLLAGCYASSPESLDSPARPGEPRSRPDRAPHPMRANEPAREHPNDAPPASPGVRWILTDDLVNARDLGGTPAARGGSVAYGALFRGPPLAALTPEGCSTFGELGIRTVIDLRVDSERAAKPTSGCVGEAAEVLEAPLPVPYNLSPHDYIAILNTREAIAAIFEQLADESAYPVYLHCTYGRDRTGVVAAVILRALGVSREVIRHEYSLSQPSVGAYPRSLDAALDAIDDAGGIEAYLASAGVSAEQLATLRKRVLSAEE